MLDPGRWSHCRHLQHLGAEGEQLPDLRQTSGLGGSKITLGTRGTEEEGRVGEGRVGEEDGGLTLSFLMMETVVFFPSSPVTIGTSKKSLFIQLSRVDTMSSVDVNRSLSLGEGGEGGKGRGGRRAGEGEGREEGRGGGEGEGRKEGRG